MNKRDIFLSSVFVIAAASPAIAAAPVAKQTAGKQPEKQEFGAHERPWARDYLAQECAARQPSLEERAPGLIESKEKVEMRIKNPENVQPAPLDAAIADTTAALTAIREERAQLEKEWRELADARALVEVASRRAQEEIAALSALRDEVSGLIDELEVRESENIAKVSELVENLKTKDAARLLATRDADFIVEVLDALDARLAAEILGKMDGVQAEDVMAIIATRGRPGQDRRP